MELNKSTERLVRSVGQYSNTSVHKTVISAVLVVFLLVAGTFLIWPWSPSYKILLSSLDDQEIISVLNTLYSNGFDAKLDQSSGAVLVPAKDIHYARITLSNYGLPGISGAFSNQRNANLPGNDHYNDKNSVLGQVEYIRRIEEVLSKRIEHMLEPLVGFGLVRAQVTINPLDNYQGKNNISDKQDKLYSRPGINNRSTTHLSGLIGENSLAIAVIVDDKKILDEQGKSRRIPRTKKELENFTDLVKKAVNFNQERGDSISVINSRFVDPVISKYSTNNIKLNNIIYQDWFRRLIFVLVFIVISFVIWQINRPVLRSNNIERSRKQDSTLNLSDELSPTEIAAEHYENNKNILNNLAQNDPKVVAQIMRNWVNADEK